MRLPVCKPVLSLGTALCLGLLASCSGRSDQFAAQGVIDAGGGTVTVTSGPLTGTAVLIPAGAVEGPTDIKIREGSRTELLGFKNVGLCTSVSPSGLGLRVNGTVTLVFAPELVPAGATESDFVVFRQTSPGRNAALEPTSVDIAGGTLQLDVERLASYWVAVQTQDLEFLLPNFLPLRSGDSYTFDNGIDLTLEDTASEPNLEGVSIVKATFARGIEGIGLYLIRAFAETFFVGSYAIDGSFQETTFPPVLFLGATGVVGRVFEDSSTVSLYQPFPTVFPAAILELRTFVKIESVGNLSTPLGTFSDVIEVSFRAEREDDAGNVAVTQDTLWLARGVGPVKISLDQVPDGMGRLTGGSVNGAPIVAR